jgi:hypothetical protein
MQAKQVPLVASHNGTLELVQFALIAQPHVDVACMHRGVLPPHCESCVHPHFSVGRHTSFKSGNAFAQPASSMHSTQLPRGSQT